MTPVDTTSTLAVTTLLEQTRWRLDVLSHDLLPGLLEQAEIIERLRRLATRGRHSRIRFLSRDTEWTARNGHALIPLLQRLPSIMQTRLAEPDHCSRPHWLMLADGHHLLLQEDMGGTPVMQPENQARIWQERFDECWEHALPDPHLRRWSL